MNVLKLRDISPCPLHNLSNISRSFFFLKKEVLYISNYTCKHRNAEFTCYRRILIIFTASKCCARDWTMNYLMQSVLMWLLPFLLFSQKQNRTFTESGPCCCNEAILVTQSLQNILHRHLLVVSGDSSDWLPKLQWVTDKSIWKSKKHYFVKVSFCNT